MNAHSPISSPGRRELRVVLASPRGFCAGVDRAIQIVERTIEKFGAPVYVRHEIVHNRHVVDRLKALGAVFIEELDEAPGDRPVVFSAHGVPKSVPAAAKAARDGLSRRHLPPGLQGPCRGPEAFRRRPRDRADRPCRPPRGGRHHGPAARGHGHPDRDIDDARAWIPQNPANVAFLTQTTLSVDDTAEMVDLLKQRFPGIAAPHKEDICYATTNRQEAVKLLAGASELVLVVGSKNSSNSVRLMEVGKRAGARDARLIDDARGIDWSWFEGAPEDLVQGVIDAVGSGSPPAPRRRRIWSRA
jgi:4-hydroxy-3-methylbut-2-enyl diphosphate reductase